MNVSLPALTAVLVALALLIGAWMSFYIVRPDQFVVLTQFGEPIDEIREPGLHFLTPFVQDARYLDNRVRGWDDVASNTNTAELKPIDFTAFARWKIDPTPGGATRFYTAVKDDRRAKASMSSVVTKRIQAAVREHRLASIVRDKGRSFGGRAASDLKFLFVDYPECQPGKNAEVKEMLDEYDEIAASLISATVTEEGKALRSEIVRNILSTSNEVLMKDFGIEILDLHFKYLNYSPQVHQEITDKITKDRGRDIARYNKLGNACTGTIRQVKEQQLGAIVGERDRRVRELEGDAIAQSIAIKAHAFNEGPGFFRFLKMLELYEDSLSSNTSFILSADNPLLALMSDPSLLRTVSKRRLAARPKAQPAPQPSTPPAAEGAKQP